MTPIDASLGERSSSTTPQGAHPLHLALVTNCYPDQRHNSEYGWHLARSLRAARPGNRVSVLAGSPGPGGPDVQRPWTFGGMAVSGQICRAVRRLDADAVVVNASFNSWGSNVANLSAFWAMRCLAQVVPTVVLLHYLPQTLPLTRTGYRLGPIHWAGIHVACRMAAAAHVVAFTLERDRLYFSDHFKSQGTIRMDHGSLGSCGQAGWQEDGAQTILAFGYWGPGKNLEMLLQAVEEHPHLRLTVAGASHPCFPGYLEALRARHPSPRIHMTGYVAEEGIGPLFRSARLVVLPYGGDTGTSGVLHLACQQGRAVLASDLAVLRHESRRLGLAVRFFQDEADLRRSLERLDDVSLLAEGRHNLEAMQMLGHDALGEAWWTVIDGLVSRDAGPVARVPVPVGS